LGGLRRTIHILHDEKVETIENVAQLALIDPRVSRVGKDRPVSA
jgi:hypothetical protein